MNSLNRINNGRYNIVHDFEESNDLIKQYIEVVYHKSLLLYAKRYQGVNATGTNKLDINKIEESLGYIEDYLYYFYKFNRDEFDNIFNNLVNNLNFVTVLNQGERGLYGKYVSNEKCLYINPEMKSSINLDSDSRIRLYINHELGHIINSEWMKSVESYLNSNHINSLIDKQLLYDGFSLFDESTTQNRAEEITYYYLNKKRPSKKFYKRGNLFDGTAYKTNYDYYGEMQEPTISFARILRGIGKIEDDTLALNEFCKRALKPNFATNIIEEFTVDGQLTNLYYLLQRLGKIKNASYASFGMGTRKDLDESLNALNEFYRLAPRLRDRREPLDQGQRRGL